MCIYIYIYKYIAQSEKSHQVNLRRSSWRPHWDTESDPSHLHFKLSPSRGCYRWAGDVTVFLFVWPNAAAALNAELPYNKLRILWCESSFIKARNCQDPQMKSFTVDFKMDLNWTQCPRIHHSEHQGGKFSFEPLLVSETDPLLIRQSELQHRPRSISLTWRLLLLWLLVIQGSSSCCLFNTVQEWMFQNPSTITDVMANVVVVIKLIINYSYK